MIEWPAIEKELKASLDSFGPYKSQVVLGGGSALYIYHLMSSSSLILPSPTVDQDYLINRLVTAKSIQAVSLEQQLLNSGFTSKLINAEGIYYWRKDGFDKGSYIEFLTDEQAGRGKTGIVERISNVMAQRLPYLEFSFENRVAFRTKSGLDGLVVHPSAYLIHKILTFHKRNSEAKKAKDVSGAIYVFTQTDWNSPKTNIDVLLKGANPKWSKTFKGQLETILKKDEPFWLQVLGYLGNAGFEVKDAKAAIEEMKMLVT